MTGISIILCVKNSEEYISETIQSVLNQTYTKWELLVYINGSTDLTFDIVNSFKDPRIKIYKTTVEQLSFNLNRGLDDSSYDVIARIDGDDIMLSNRLEEQIKYLSDYDVVGSAALKINSKGDIIGSFDVPESDEKIRKALGFKNPIIHPSVMFKKSVILKNHGFLGGLYAQDFDMWLRLIRDKNIKFFNVQQPLIKYRIHDSQSKGKRESYANVASYLLREFICTRKFKYLLNSKIYVFKSFLRGK
ncbi:MAG: glycosyltransferase [Spirochaetales bacterium]|nr:glycosyltransferase [Spirochaetales bacterium]